MIVSVVAAEKVHGLPFSLRIRVLHQLRHLKVGACQALYTLFRAFSGARSAAETGF